MHCSSNTLVGGGLRSYYNGKIAPDILTGIYLSMQCHKITDICFHKKDSHSFVSWRLPPDYPTCQIYFVFRKEIYYISEYEDLPSHLCIYSLRHKEFIRLRHRLKDFEKLTADRVLMEEGNDSDFTIMYIPTEAYEEKKKFALVKLSMQSPWSIEEYIEKIDTTFHVYKCHIVWDARDRKILFFDEARLHIYDMASEAFDVLNVSIQLWRK